MPMRLAMHLMVLTMFAPLALGAMPPAGTHVSLPAASTNTSQQAQAVARPYRVGLQIGHYKNNELPDVLYRLEGSTGAVASATHRAKAGPSSGAVTKSPSACMRCTRTEPTIPRQPTMPTFMLASMHR